MALDRFKDTVLFDGMELEDALKLQSWETSTWT